MLSRLAYRINQRLEPGFPEQRLFLKSDVTTRFVRLSPLTQAISVAVGVLVVGWTVLATAILLMDFINAGSSHDQVQRQTTLFEQRLNILSDDRDLWVAEARATFILRNATARVGDRDRRDPDHPAPRHPRA